MPANYQNSNNNDREILKDTRLNQGSQNPSGSGSAIAPTAKEASLILTPRELDDSTRVYNVNNPSYKWLALAPGADITQDIAGLWVKDDVGGILATGAPALGVKLLGVGLWNLQLSFSLNSSGNVTEGLRYFIGAFPEDYEGSYAKYLSFEVSPILSGLVCTANVSFWSNDQELSLTTGFAYGGADTGNWALSDVRIDLQRIQYEEGN